VPRTALEPLLNKRNHETPMTKDDIFSFLKSQFAIERSEVDENTGLFSEGLLDSFSIVDLVMYIENTSGIKMQPADVNLENLDSVSKIMNFVSKDVSH
jgi:acyl carrier protein